MYTNRIFRLLAVATLALAGVLALLLILPANSPDTVQASPLESQAPPFPAGEEGQGVRSPTAGTARYVATTGLDAGNCSNSAAPCRTVQYAVDMADSGDEIKVATGVYTGVQARPAPAGYSGTVVITQVVYISKTVNIQGGYTTTNNFADPPDSLANPAILDAQNQGRVIFAAGHSSSTIEGLHIVGGNATGLGGHPVGPLDGGGGVYLYQSDHAVLRGNNIYSNTAPGTGGGVYVYTSTHVQVSDNHIYNNTTPQFSGGGVYVYKSHHARLANNQVYNNTVGQYYAGGILVGQCNNAELIGNLVYGNSAPSDGGISLWSNNNLLLSGNQIYRNTSQHIGGIGLYFNTNAVLKNNMIFENRLTSSSSNASGIYITDSTVHFLHNTIARNTGGYGHGIYLSPGSSTIWMTNTILVSQTTGLYVYHGNTATLEATLWGDGIWANGTDVFRWGQVSTGTVEVWGDPAFVDPAAGDYHLGLGSAAIDAGVDAGVTTDIDGDPRPLGGGYDIGADEFYGIGVYLVPPSQAGSGGPGATVAYTAQLINQTGITDSFTLSIQPGNAWTTTLSLTQTGALPNGANLPFTVEVEIPSSALSGEWDSITVQAVSVSSPTVYSDTAAFTTTAHINSAPIAVDDSGPSFTTDKHTAFTTASVLANDTDPDGDPLAVQSFDTSGTIGLVSFGGNLAAGSLDTSGFGAPLGYVTTDFGFSSRGRSIAIQPDGKIVVVGTADDFIIARYNPDGSLDTSFDSDGKVTTDFVGFYDGGLDAAIQPDGKLVVAGYAHNGNNFDLALARYNPDGSLDTSFDGDGKVTTDWGSDNFGFGVALQADGKLVVTGYAYNGSNNDFALARYNPDGSLDTSFDGDGKVTTDWGSDDYGYRVVIQSNGKLVMAGSTGPYGNRKFALARYNIDGSLDTSFDGDGQVVTDFGNDAGGQSIALQADGKIVMAGYAHNVSNNDFALARYNPDGSLDTSFDGDGKVTTNFGADDYGYDIACQSDGKLVVAGNANSNNDFALARYNEDGSLDISFGSNGLVTTNLSDADTIHDIVIQSDGKLVVAGYTDPSGSYDYDFAVARYNPDGSSAFLYDPNGQFGWLAVGEVTTDTFTYVVSDGALTDTATVSITIIGVNAAPIAMDDKGIGFTTDENTAFTTTSVLTNDTDLDGDPLTVQSYDTSGVLGLVSPGGGDGIFTYNPNGQFEWLAAGEVATDTFTYVVSDGALTDTATVHITVIGINAAPIAVDDSGPGFTTDENTAFTTTSVLTNDTDLDGDPLAVQSFDASGTLGLVTFGGSGTAGNLDTSGFGAPLGYVTTNFSISNFGESTAIQPDGKIVVAGRTNNGSDTDFAMARYNPDGSLDISFDGDGKVTTDFGSDDYCYDIALQSDGKIVVAGYVIDSSGDNFALARYNTNGSLDTSFDGDGIVTTDFGFYDHGYAIALQPNGKIVVAGDVVNPITGSDFAVARYNPDGSLDISFDSDGKVTTNFGYTDFGYDIALQSDGKIVVAGSAYNGSNYDFTLICYNPDGSLDATFGGDGLVTTDIAGNDDSGSNVVIQSDGKIVVAGTSGQTMNSDFAVVRYDPDGSLDTTFDGDGTVLTDLGDSSGATSMIIQLDDKLVAAGLVGVYSTDIALVRYNPDGSLDTTFNDDGKVTTNINPQDSITGIAIQSDGKLVVAGTTGDEMGTYFDFIVARYNAGGGNAFLYDPNDQFEWLAAGEVATDTFTYVASDGALTDTATVSITIIGVNDAPVLGAIGDKNIDEGIQLTFTVTATEVDLSDSLTFSLDAGSVGSITAGGVFTWTPTETQGPGIYTATVRVADSGVPSLDDAETITITVEEVNTAPMLGSIGNKAVDELATLVFTATATDGDIPTQTLTFSLDAGSVGSLTADGVFTWTPQTAGSYTATVRVTDSGAPSLEDAETITITVNEVSAAPGTPSLLWPANGTLTTTQAITFTWQAGPGDPPIGYNLLLDGELVTTSATFSATILPSGMHTWTVRAYNAEGYSNWVSPAWTVEIIQHRIYLPLILK